MVLQGDRIRLKVENMRLLGPLIALTLLGLGACSTTGSLRYQAPAAVAPGAPSVSGVVASDVRDEKPNRVATIRGGYGNPIEVLDTARPVGEEVAAVVTSALQARGLLGQAGAAPYRIQLVIRTLYGNQYFVRKAYIDMDLKVIDRTGVAVYADTVKNERGNGGALDLFPKIEDLGKLVQELLSASVDSMLDRPALRAVLSGGGRQAIGS